MKQNNIISFRGVERTVPEVVAIALQSEKEIVKALKALQERKTVILDLNRLTAEKAQRVVDWMSGGTLAIAGRTVWIGEQTFLFAPSSVKVVIGH